MAWLRGEEKKLTEFLLSEENRDIFEPEIVDKDLLCVVDFNLFRAAQDIEEFPDLYGVLSNHSLRVVLDDENFSKCPECIKAYAFTGKKRAMVALKGIANLLLIKSEWEKDPSEKEKTEKRIFFYKKKLCDGIELLSAACLLGKAFNEITRLSLVNEAKERRRGNFFLNVRVRSKNRFQTRVEFVLFKMYEFLFLPKQEKPSEEQIEQQSEIRKAVAILEKKIDKDLVAFTSDKKSFIWSFISLLSILNGQLLEAEAYVRLTELPDSQLMLRERKFVETRFREIGLFLNNQLFRGAMMLSMEGLHGLIGSTNGNFVTSYFSIF